MKIDMKYVKEILLTEDELDSIKEVSGIVEEIARSLGSDEVLLEDRSLSYSCEDVKNVLYFLNGMCSYDFTIVKKSEVEDDGKFGADPDFVRKILREWQEKE